MTNDSNGSVLIEVIAREDCPNRGMALIVVERVVDETGIPAAIEIVEVASDEDAETYRALGSPTVLVDGRDVDPDPTLFDYSADDRIYRTHRGPCGWPAHEWIRDAQLLQLIKLEVTPDRVSKLRSVLHYNGLPIDARSVTDDVLAQEDRKSVV